MEFLSALASAGVFISLPVLGVACCLCRLGHSASRRWSPVAVWGVAGAVGVALWSVPLLLAAELGLYRSWAMGAIGWGVVVLFLFHRRRTAAPSRRSLQTRWDRWEALLAVGLVVAAGLLWGFPSDSMLGGIDQGVYANVGVFLEREGHLEIPLPTHDFEDPVPAYERIPGFRVAEPDTDGTVHLTPQFAHLFPVWLAQAHGTLGLAGLLRLNGLLALLALACFYATALMVVDRPVAVAATLVLAFNPGQIWVARITLSETLAQVLIWAALAMLVRLDGRGVDVPARWGGLLLGLVALARVDGFVLLPLIFIAHGAFRVFGRSSQGRSSVDDSPREPWSAFYQTAIPTFVIAAASYALWSPFYLEGMAPYLAPVGVVTLAALYLVLAWTPTVGEKVRRALRPAFLRVSVVGVLVIAAVWAYWVRPIPEPTAEEISRWLASRAAAIAAGTVDVTVPSAEWPDWGRNTLSNLGRYLSPWIIALSVLGVGRALWLTFELRLRSGLLALFVVWGGFTVAYLYDPAVDPLHFWAIRRFTPLVLPGFVLAAALGWRYGVRRLPSRLRPLAGAGIVLALTLHGVSVTGPLAGFARDQGVTAQLAAVAEELPADDVVLVPTFRAGWAQWQTPLHFVFQRRLHPFDTASPRRMQRVIDWIDRRRSAGKPVHLLVERATLPADCCPYKELVGQFPLDRQVMEPTYWPVARTVRHSQRWLELYRLPPRSPAVASEP